VTEFFAGLCLIIGVALGVPLLRTRGQLRQIRLAHDRIERARAEAVAMLDTVPLASFRWSAGAEADDGPVRSASYARFLAGLAPDGAARVEAVRSALRRRDRSRVSTTLSTLDGRAFAIEGRRTKTGESVLWLIDNSAAAVAKEACNEAASLREMIDAIPLPVWRRARDLGVVDCNRAYARALDTTRERALAEGRELAPGAVRPQSDGPGDAVDCTAARGGKPAHIVIDGSRRLLEFVETPCEAGGTVGFALDRTDVESAEAELRRHINAHAAVLEGIGAAVAIYGPDKRLQFFNAAFASLWGIEAEWLAAKPSLEGILERLREHRRLPEVADFRAFKDECARLFTSLIEPRQELMHLPDDRTLLLSVTPHPFGGLTFVYEDVTDRLALERSCNTLTQVRRATLDHLFEGIAVYGSDGRLKLHNPAYLAIWGLSEQDVAGEPHIGEIVEKTRPLLDHGGEWAEIKRGMIAKITAQTPASGPLYRQDGSMLQVATVPLPDGNVLMTYLDVTDTARVERALRERNEALETAGRLKSEFIANVSYELRTPLNAVIGFAEILANRYFGDLNPRQLDYSRSIVASSHQLMKLINDILDLATIEAGYLALDTKRVEILGMLRSVVKLTRERARSRELTLDLRCPPDIGAIEADETRLKQALFNLISNAIKFTPPGGAISVAAERGEGELRLIVADTGVGIAQSDQLRVFEKFERGTRQSGAGLGLSLVKNLIELHGGTVAIDSAPERGTRIICRLPAAHRTVAPPAALTRPSDSAHDAARAEYAPVRTRSGGRRTAEARVAA